MMNIVDMRTRKKWRPTRDEPQNGPRGAARRYFLREAESPRRGRNEFQQIGEIAVSIVDRLAR